MSIRFRAPPLPTLPPAWRRLLVEMRAVIEGSRFSTLDELGAIVRGRDGPTDKREGEWISELARGSRFPQHHDFKAIILHCDPRAWPRIEQVYNLATAEQLATQEGSGQARGGTPVRSQEPPLPLVGDCSNWDRLGVHRPITLLSSGQDLTAEAAAGVLPS